MGPFVPDIITEELNLIVALLLGIGFGVVLEQAPVRAEEATYRFRARASVILPKMIEENKNREPKLRPAGKKIAGGC